MEGGPQDRGATAVLPTGGNGHGGADWLATAQAFHQWQQSPGDQLRRAFFGEVIHERTGMPGGLGGYA